MMSFRTLFPAPRKGDEDEGSPDSAENPGKKPKVGQACSNCKKAKVKCSGEKPECEACAAKNRECTYDETPQARMAAIQDRIDTLEQLFSRLRTGTSDEAREVLTRIRADEDASEILIATHGRNTTSEGSIYSTREESFSGGSSSKDSPTTMSSRILGPSTSGMIKLLLPGSSTTKKAVDSFFRCSGKLFHVFTRQQIDQYHAAVFGRPQRMTDGIEAEVGSLMAVAAVGAQYLPDEFNQDVENAFYEIAKFFFEFVIEEHPVQAIKICTTLAHYNIMNKHTTSLAYIEIGLGMCRKYGWDHKAIRSSSTVEPDMVDPRRTWRTLIFFSSWLSTSIGYISGNETMSAAEVVSQFGQENIDDVGDVVQTELTKICLIKAELLRMHLSFKKLSAQSIRSIRGEMQNWYKNLPADIRLENTSSDTVSADFKRTVFHVHLIHLDLILLLYRRIATHMLQGYSKGSSGVVMQAPIDPVMLDQANDAAIAANTSARILKLLQEDSAIYKRCWLVIFQSYTTCIVLLHMAVQKQANNFPPPTWENEKKDATKCLEILKFCSSADPVAANFHRQVSDLFTKIFERNADNSQFRSSTECANSRSDTSMRDIDMQDVRYLVYIPTQCREELTDLSLTLFAILSQPFDTNSNDATGDGKRKLGLEDTMLHEYPQVAKRYGWEISCAPLEWDTIKQHAASGSTEQQGKEQDASMGSDTPPN